jgi:hypothetical protein
MRLSRLNGSSNSCKKVLSGGKYVSGYSLGLARFLRFSSSRSGLRDWLDSLDEVDFLKLELALLLLDPFLLFPEEECNMIQSFDPRYHHHLHTFSYRRRLHMRS